MISYTILWKKMKEKKETTYTLRCKYGLSHSTVQRLQNDMHVSTYTLDRLCKILDCDISDIVKYIQD